MITIETNRTTPIYSNAKGDSKDGLVKKEDRLLSETARSSRKSGRSSTKSEIKSIKEKVKSGELSRQEARKLKRKSRKVKRGAVKLQLTKRFTKDGKPLFIYRLKKVFKTIDGKLKKKLADGTEVEVKATDVVTTPQGTYDANDIAKASGVSTAEVKSNPAVLESVTTTVTPNSSNSEIATETSSSSSSADLAVEVPSTNVYNETSGQEDGLDYSTGDALYLKSDTEATTSTESTTPDATAATTDATTDKKLKTWEKVLLFGGVALVLGLVTFAIVKRKK